eukprot:4584054-Amphidinium_carterae.1
MPSIRTGLPSAKKHASACARHESLLLSKTCRLGALALNALTNKFAKYKRFQGRLPTVSCWTL